VSRRFVLLDRDGTINEEVGYVLESDALALIPGSASAIRDLRELGLGTVVVTNQAPVARGWITEGDLATIHARLEELLAAEGAGVDAIEHCPHDRDDGCACRKPGTLMVERAVARFGFDPTQAFVVGDHAGDMELGRRVGATTILVRTGHGPEELDAARPFADHVVADLREAADLIRDEVAAAAER
jgi:D-glycero-D-manno-heptose 1,7-bisphosphate phosphatase